LQKHQYSIPSHIVTICLLISKRVLDTAFAVKRGAVYMDLVPRIAATSAALHQSPSTSPCTPQLATPTASSCKLHPSSKKYRTRRRQLLREKERTSCSKSSCMRGYSYSTFAQIIFQVHYYGKYRSPGTTKYKVISNYLVPHWLSKRR
jgi:hypothetical protein